MKEIICVVCPKGCRIGVNEEGKISGYGCLRGLKYAEDELTCPKRTLTSTVKIISRELKRLPVSTNRDIPKEKMMDVMRVLNKVVARAPIRLGAVIVANVLDTGADIVATRSVLE